MIVRTLNAYTAINCGCCDYPSCDSPRLSCESRRVTVEECGTFPSNPNYGGWSALGCPEKTSRYRRKVRTLTINRTGYDTRQTIATTVYSIVSGICSSTTTVEEVGTITPPEPSWADTPVRTQGGDFWYNYEVTGSDSGNTYSYVDHLEFSERVTGNPSELLTDALSEIDELDWNYSDCKSSIEVTQDTSAYECFTPTAAREIDVVGARYKMGIPEDYERSTYELQWDEVFASSEWWAWFDSSSTDPEPTPAPVLVNSRSWIYGGTDEFSDWFEIPVPEEPGETRKVNMMVVCWKSAKVGYKPTAFGDQVAVEYPE